MCQQSSSGNPSAPPAQAPYNPSYQQAPPGGYGGAPQGYGGTPQGYGGAPQGYGGAPQGYGGAHAGGYAPPPAGYGGAPGYGAPGSTGSGAPPGADPTLWSWFQVRNSLRDIEICDFLICSDNVPRAVCYKFIIWETYFAMFNVWS